MQTDDQPQGSHMYVLTLQGRNGDTCTISGTYTPHAGWSRFDFYTRLRTEAARSYPAMENAKVLFFSLDRNTL